MTNATLTRTLFWLGIAGLVWLLANTVFVPMRVVT
jgi:hypothetical protein